MTSRPECNNYYHVKVVMIDNVMTSCMYDNSKSNVIITVCAQLTDSISDTVPLQNCSSVQILLDKYIK